MLVAVMQRVFYSVLKTNLRECVDKRYFKIEAQG
jgi:hypothetical protein